MMRWDLRWLLVFAGNAVYHLIFVQVNHYATNLPFGASGMQVFFFTLGLPVAFAALRLNLRHGLGAVIPTALLTESSYPVAPGTLLLPAVACLCLTLSVRANFNRFDTVSAVLTGILINLVLALVLTAAVLPEAFAASRLVVDVVVSQLAIILLTPWFFAAQEAWLQIFGCSLDTELREPL